MDDTTRSERDLSHGLGSTGGEWFEEVSGGAHPASVRRRVSVVPRDFDAVLFDAGGVLLVPDPSVLSATLAYYGAVTNHEAFVRAHFAGMAAKSRSGAGENDWSDYNTAFVRAVGVAPVDEDAAAFVLSRTRHAHLWRTPLRGSAAALHELNSRDVPIGVVSNASGQIEEILMRSGICQVGDGPHARMRCIVDSHVVGVMKPDPRIFDFALPHFGGIEPARIAYVGDSVVMDVGGARSAGLTPVLMDPWNDSADLVDCRRIGSLLELLD